MKGSSEFFLQFASPCRGGPLLVLEAITLTPARCSQFLAVGGERTASGASPTGCSLALGALLAPSRPALHHRKLVLAGRARSLRASLASFPFSARSSSPPRTGNVMVRLQTPVGSSIWETEKLFGRPRRSCADGRRSAGSSVDRGMGGARSTARRSSSPSLEGERMSQPAFMDVVRKEFNSYPGVAPF